MVTEFPVSISEFCSCCDGAAIELSAGLFKTIESCTGSPEAPIACTCLNGSSQVNYYEPNDYILCMVMLLACFIMQCQERFSSTSGSCFLDTDRDGKPDYVVFIYIYDRKYAHMLIVHECMTCVLAYIFVICVR